MLNGVFPTAVPVFVWFGDLAIQTATSNGTTLLVDSPAVPFISRQTVVDVVVKFSTSQTHELTLVDAFTFTVGNIVTAPTTTVGGGSGGGGSGGSGGSTGGSTPTMTTTPTAPGTPTTTVPASPPGTPTLTPPTTTTVPRTSPVVTTTTVPATTVPAGPATPARTVGALNLYTATSGAVAALAVAAWPNTGCAAAAC